MELKPRRRFKMGLREKKKAKTRKMISDLATHLFIKKGYDAVTVAEIAEKAEVAVTTLFNYFPTKESLVFDEDAELKRMLLEAVAGRAKTVTILEALQSHFLSLIALENKLMVRKGREDFQKLVKSTPELSRAYRELWNQHERAVVKLILSEKKQRLSTIEVEAMVHQAVDAYVRASETSNPKANLTLLFKGLREGWES